MREASSLRVAASTSFTNNSAVGKNTNGGAVWLNAAAEARISGATFKNNMVQVKAEYGYGGALHVEATKAWGLYPLK